MADTEKVSFNMSVVDLGQIDYLVEQGFYSSRTDCIRTGVRNLLLTHAATVQQAISRNLIALGVVLYDRKTLESYVASRRQLQAQVIGVVVLEDDITPELARSAIKSLKVFGVLRATPDVKAALQDRLK